MNKYRIILYLCLIISMIFTQQLFAESNEAASELQAVYANRMLYKGTIGDNFGITMELQDSARDYQGVSGFFIYHRFGRRIPVSGFWEEAGNLELKEEQNVYVRGLHATMSSSGGNFNLTFSPDRLTASGTWTNAAKTRSLKVRMTRLASYFCFKMREDVKVEFPVFDNPALAQLNVFLKTRMQQNFSELVYEWHENEKAILKSDSEELKAMKCRDYYVSSDHVTLVTDNIVCFESALWQYFTGNPHGRNSSSGYIILPDQGSWAKPRAVSVYDLFSDTSSFFKIAEKIAAYCLVRKGASKLVDGEMTEDDVALDTILLGYSGLEVKFDPYQVGSYVEGDYFAFIPYFAIKRFIPEGSPLQDLLKNQ